ncbi:hypothetical protein ACFXK0_21525 [Nocardia sp. NPDC059177]|uniref:hypothetical protein n=1 Tax=Nocardia sp. NPDC059177 TaxID=3346759 RepID=UPI0036AA0E29
MMLDNVFIVRQSVYNAPHRGAAVFRSAAPREALHTTQTDQRRPVTYPHPQPFQPPRPPVHPNGSAKPLVIALAAVGGLCTIGILLAAIGAVTGSGDNTTATSRSVASPAATIHHTSIPAAPVYDVPSEQNIAPELTVTEKSCFGSAGCIFEYELRIVTTTPVEFHPSKRYRVTVALDEGTDWERLHSITVTGKKAGVITGHVSSDTSTTPVATIQTITPL